MDAFDYLSLLLSVLVIVSHLYGLRLLNRVGDKHTFIANYSWWLIFWAISNLARYPIIRFATTGSVYVYWTLVIEGARIPFYLAILYITFDRFFQLFLHLRYERSFLRKHKLTFCMLSLLIYIVWLVVTIPLFHERLVSFEVLIQITSLYVSACFHVLIALMFITVYSYIAYKLSHSKNGGGISSVDTKKKRKSKVRKLAVPIIIVTAFILFQTVPDCFIFFGSAHYGSWTIFLFRIDALMNALIYIFLQPRVKQTIRHRIRRFTEYRKRHVQINTGVDTSLSTTNVT